MRHRFIALASAFLAGLGLAVGTAAQEASLKPDESLLQRFHSLMGQGAYLEAISLLEERWESRPPVEQSSYVQRRPELDGFIVRTEGDRPPLPPVDPEVLAQYEAAEAVDALAEIVARAGKTRVVIVNETHDNPRDRAFVLAVAEALRPLGYTYYAAETLGNWGTEEQKARRMDGLVADGYPNRSAGTYSSDPMFGSLIRGVLRLGYRPVPYEQSPEQGAARSGSRDEQIAWREQAQAENLARAIAAAGPEAKFLIHVGYSHAAERPLGPPGNRHEWMASRLARMTGIDPLTVDQTDFGESSAGPAMRALHAALAERTGERAKVFLTDGKSLGGGYLGEVTDLQVFHPPIRALRGRPDWLRHTGRKAVEIPADLLPPMGRRLIQAFAEVEPPEAIPIDQVLVRAGDEPPVLYVPEGTAIRWEMQEGA